MHVCTCHSTRVQVRGTFPELIFSFHSGFCGPKFGYKPFKEKHFYQLPSFLGYIVYFKNTDFLVQWHVPEIQAPLETEMGDLSESSI